MEKLCTHDPPDCITDMEFSEGNFKETNGSSKTDPHISDLDNSLEPNITNVDKTFTQEKDEETLSSKLPEIDFCSKEIKNVCKKTVLQVLNEDADSKISEKNDVEGKSMESKENVGGNTDDIRQETYCKNSKEAYDEYDKLYDRLEGDNECQNNVFVTEDKIPASTKDPVPLEKDLDVPNIRNVFDSESDSDEEHQ